MCVCGGGEGVGGIYNLCTVPWRWIANLSVDVLAYQPVSD